MSIYQQVESSVLSLLKSNDHRAITALGFSKLRPFVRNKKKMLGIRVDPLICPYEIASQRLWDLGYYEAAVAVRQRSISSKGKSFESVYELGRCLHKADKLSEAVNAFREAITINPDQPAVYHEIGRTYFHLGDYHQAIESLISCIKLDSEFIHSYILLARILLNKNDIELAESVVSEIRKNQAKEDPNSGYAIYGLIQVLLKRKEISLAEECLAEFKHQSEKNILVKACVAQIEEIKGNFDTANQLFGEVLDKFILILMGENPSCSAEQTINIARQLNAMNFYTLSIYAYKKALAMDPDNFKFHRELGTALYSVGRYSEALKQYDSAIQQSEPLDEVLFEMGRCQIRIGDLQGAVDTLEKLLEHDPNHFRGKIELARLCRNIGDFSRAKHWVVGVPPGVGEEIRNLILGDMAVYEGQYFCNLESPKDYQPKSDSVLKVLETSLPHKPSGYTYRSNYILSNLQKHGFNVEAITRPGFPADVSSGKFLEASVVGGITYNHTPIDGSPNYNRQPLNLYLQKYSQSVLELALKNRPGIIHAASNFKNGIAAASAAKALKLPWVYELRGIWEDTQVSKGAITEESDRYKFFRAAENFCLTDASSVVTISQTLKQEIVSRGICSDKVFVVPNAVDVDKFPVVSKDKELAECLDLGSDQVIGYISSLVAYEGIDLLIRSFAKLVKSMKNVRLLIVGGGEEYEALNELTQELGVQDKVLLTGRVPHDEVLRYYSLIDIFVVPRLPWRVCEIVTPLKPYEAMSTGRTVVVSDVSALQEMIVHGQTGLSFKAGDPDSLTNVLKSLLRNPEQRMQLGENAATWVRKNRTWEMVTAEYKRAYQYAIENYNQKTFQQIDQAGNC